MLRSWVQFFQEFPAVWVRLEGCYLLHETRVLTCLPPLPSSCEALILGNLPAFLQPMFFRELQWNRVALQLPVGCHLRVEIWVRPSEQQIFLQMLLLSLLIYRLLRVLVFRLPYLPIELFNSFALSALLFACVQAPMHLSSGQRQ